MEKRKPRVVFTFVEAGMGHLVPATGISDAFERKYGDKFEIIRWKIFSDSKHQEVIDYQQSIINDTKRQANSKIYAFLFHWISEILGKKGSQALTSFHFRKAVPLIVDEIKQMKPDLIFSTYCSPSQFAVKAKKSGEINPIIGTYVPDPIIHNGWEKQSDILIVNNSQAYDIAKKDKFKEVFEVPFVLRKEAYEITESKEEMREKLGLPKDKFTILLCDGAYGQKNLVRFSEELIKLDLPITVISICGRNEKAFEYLSGLKDKVNPKVTFLPLGFTRNMLDYDRASDLFVGKSGANALVESFYFGVPAVVSGFANILEKHIYNYYIKKLGCGVGIFKADEFVKFVKEVVKDKSKLEVFKKNLEVFHDASGGEKAADILYEALKKKFNLGD